MTLDDLRYEHERLEARFARLATERAAEDASRTAEQKKKDEALRRERASTQKPPSSPSTTYWDHESQTSRCVSVVCSRLHHRPEDCIEQWCDCRCHDLEGWPS